MLLRPYLTSTITTTCCLTTCPLQVHSVQSMSVTLSQPSKLTSSIFLDAPEDWQHPSDSQCGRKFSNKPAEEILFNEDVTFDEHGHADTSWHCAWMRVSSRHVALNLKSVLVFSVDLLSRGGNLKFSNTPQSIFFVWEMFTLYGATLWNGGHYICTFYYNNMWYLYDGLSEYRRKGSGLWSSSCMFHEPLGFSLSFLIYCS